MSLRITPAADLPTKHTQTGPSAPSAPGLYDTLRARQVPASQQEDSVKSTHPLEARLSNWNATREALKTTLLRRQFGIAAPVQRGMEMLSVERGAWDVMPGLYGGGRAVHADVLMGRDWEVDGWEDVYSSPDVGFEGEWQAHVDRRVNQGW